MVRGCQFHVNISHSVHYQHISPYIHPHFTLITTLGLPHQDLTYCRRYRIPVYTFFVSSRGNFAVFAGLQSSPVESIFAFCVPRAYNRADFALQFSTFRRAKSRPPQSKDRVSPTRMAPPLHVGYPLPTATSNFPHFPAQVASHYHTPSPFI